MRFLDGKLPEDGGVPSGNSVSERPAPGYFLPEIGVYGRIIHVQPAAQNGQRPSPGFERTTVRGGVDAERKAAHDGNAAQSQIGGQFFEQI